MTNVGLTLVTTAGSLGSHGCSPPPPPPTQIRWYAGRTSGLLRASAPVSGSGALLEVACGVPFVFGIALPVSLFSRNDASERTWWGWTTGKVTSSLVAPIFVVGA